MIELRPGHHIVSEFSGELVVNETSLERLSAGTPGITAKGDEYLTMSGTYLPRHIGRVLILGTWDVDRLAKAMARTFWIEGNDIYNEEMISMHLNGLQEEMNVCIPYIADELNATEAERLLIESQEQNN